MEGGGCWLSDSCFPSALSQLQPAGRGLAGPQRQSAAWSSAGAKNTFNQKVIPICLAISVQTAPPPNFPPRPSGSFMLCRYVQIRGQVLAVPATIWERLRLFLIVFHLFTAALLCSAVTLFSALSACYLRPPSTCNSRLAVLKSSHSSAGADISTCSSPLQEKKFGQSGCFHFKHAVLPFISGSSYQLHPFLHSLTPGFPSFLHRKISYINACLRQEGAACGLEKSHLSAGLHGMDAKFALSSVQLWSPRRLHIGAEMINCCGSCSLLRSPSRLKPTSTRLADGHLHNGLSQQLGSLDIQPVGATA